MHVCMYSFLKKLHLGFIIATVPCKTALWDYSHHWHLHVPIRFDQSTKLFKICHIGTAFGLNLTIPGSFHTKSVRYLLAKFLMLT